MTKGEYGKGYYGILYKEEDEIQISNWINKIISKKPYFNREKHNKEVLSKRRKV